MSADRSRLVFFGGQELPNESVKDWSDGSSAMKPSGAMSRQLPLDLVEQCPQPGTAIRIQHVDKSNSPE
jgi:hypothetical protein